MHMIKWPAIKQLFEYEVTEIMITEVVGYRDASMNTCRSSDFWNNLPQKPV